MSKKKPALVFRCACAGNKTVHVVARHQKGALSVVRQHDIEVLKLESGKPAIRKVDDAFASDAINARP